MLCLLLGLGLLVLLPAGAAGADASASARQAVDVPGIDVCSPTPPLPEIPDAGLGGEVGERPGVVSPVVRPETVWSSGAFAGMYAEHYDLGCASDPTSYLRIATAEANAAGTNTFLAVGYTATSLADSIDRRAWNPTWIKAFLGEFASNAVSIIEMKVLAPFLGAGIAAAVLILVVRYRDGNMVGAAQGVCWLVFVLALAAFLSVGPTWAAGTTQSAGGGLVSALHGGPNPSDAASDRTTEAVHYQGWLRRTFGTENADVAQRYGADVLASRRITWSEYDSVKGNPKALADLRKAKQKFFAETAAKIKAEDPGAYLWLTGAKDGSGIAFAEMLYSLSANFFRIAVDLLLIMATVMLVMLGIAWLIGAAWLITPWGRGLGIGLLNASARAVGYVLTAAVGSWAFGLYLMAALAPGGSVWWSVVLLFVGTIIAWTLIRPDRKALSLATMGQVNGAGTTSKLLAGLLLSYGSGLLAGNVAAKKVREQIEVDVTPQAPAGAPAGAAVAAQPLPPMPENVVYARVYSPGATGLPSEEIVDGEVLYESSPARVGPAAGGSPAALGAVHPHAERPASAGPDVPTPPPSGSVGEVVLWQRPEQGDEWVPCPHCKGAGCQTCGDGIVPRWAADEMSGGSPE